MLENIGNILNRVGKHAKYLINAVLLGGLITLIGFEVFKFTHVQFFILSLLFVSAGTLILHYPNVRIKNFAPSTILPLTLLYSAYVFMLQYEDIGLLLKTIVVVYFGGLSYLVSLIDNILLVVYEKEEAIPLYRAAASWSQVVQMLVAIPLLAGVYQLNLIFVAHTFLVLGLTFLFVVYQLWVLRFDPDAKRVRVGEGLFLILLSSFFVAIATVSVSFIPAEEFLRALFTASVLLFSLNYVAGYIKNEINSRLLFQYFSIIVVFFSLLMLFVP